MPRVLIVDDDINICKIVEKYFLKEGFEILISQTGEDALNLIHNNSLELIIMDLMLPGMDGNEVCQIIREKHHIPIIMLTAKGEVYDRIKSLNIGADDYVIKPFDPNELVARAGAVLRRMKSRAWDKSNVIKFDFLIINKDSCEVFVGNQKAIFPRREYMLLEFLACNPNIVFSRSQLIEAIWGFDFDGEDRVIDLYIERIRKRIKIKRDTNWTIKTVWGMGYKFEVNL